MSASLSEDEIAAENLKYGTQIAMICQLPSGAYAVWNAQRVLLGVTTSMETMMLLVAQAPSTLSSPPPRTRSTTLTLDDLDL